MIRRESKSDSRAFSATPRVHVLTRITDVTFQASSCEIEVCETMAQNKIEAVQPDRIAETFAGRRILITGATGFLGKVLLEKLLRCLPDIAQIYMLVRPKKGKEPKDRLDEILDSAVRFVRLVCREICQIATERIFRKKKESIECNDR